MKLPFGWTGRTALVTGGASGIGEATCRALTSAGAQVYIADVDASRSAALASQLPGASVLDSRYLRRSRRQSRVGNNTQTRHLVNNAGIGMVAASRKPSCPILAAVSSQRRRTVSHDQIRHAAAAGVRRLDREHRFGRRDGRNQERFAYCASKEPWSP